MARAEDQVLLGDPLAVITERGEDVSNYNMLHDEQAATLGMTPYLRRGFAGEAVVIPPVAYDTPETLKTGRKRWFQALIYPVLDKRLAARSRTYNHDTPGKCLGCRDLRR